MTKRRDLSVNARAASGWLPLLGVPLAVAAGWIAYSKLAIDRRRDLPPALPGDTFSVSTSAGPINLYVDGRADGTPLLLVHSVNAAASAYEVRPLYLYYRASRPVYAIELPGFGFSQRDDRTYTPRLMTDAIHAAVSEIRARHEQEKVDVIGLSLGCEYAARAALEEPQAYRSLGLISPTGFDGPAARDGRDQANRGKPLVRSAVSAPLWSRALFDLLTTGPSIRFFLRKTWGSPAIDEGLFNYDRLTTHQPGAEHVVWSFLAGYLFSDDISRVYNRLRLPVWAVHGRRGDFVDYRRLGGMAQKPNWTVQALDAGALPHFERLEAIVASYDAFHAAAVKASDYASAAA